jgi:hypothetical protein
LFAIIQTSLRGIYRHLRLPFCFGVAQEFYDWFRSSLCAGYLGYVIRVDHDTNFAFSGLPLKSDQSQSKDTEILASKRVRNVNVAVS